jgi:hypothetical protein
MKILENIRSARDDVAYFKRCVALETKGFAACLNALEVHLREELTSEIYYACVAVWGVTSIFVNLIRQCDDPYDSVLSVVEQDELVIVQRVLREVGFDSAAVNDHYQQGNRISWEFKW